MIRVKDYNHIGIVVKKLGESVWFYGEVLGLRSIERPAFDFAGHWYQVGNHTQLHLILSDTSKLTGSRSRKDQENVLMDPIGFFVGILMVIWWKSPGIKRHPYLRKGDVGSTAPY
jgi:catechol 2,3-dioxygenase-like lactoylglutathione lyase family enzyme